MSVLLYKEKKKAIAHVVSGLYEMEIGYTGLQGWGYVISGVLYFCTCVYVQYTCACVHWCEFLRLTSGVFFSCFPLNTSEAHSFVRCFTSLASQSALVFPVTASCVLGPDCMQDPDPGPHTHGARALPTDSSPPVLRHSYQRKVSEI